MVSMSACFDRRLWFLPSLIPLLAATLATAAFAQTSVSSPPNADSQAVPPTAVPTAAAELPAFEVAAIKESKSGAEGSNSNTSNGRFTASNVTLKNVMQYQAYGIPASRILDGPKWIDSARFDIEAKADGSVMEQLKTLDRKQRGAQMRTMFQQLLAERFKLAVHWETRELPVYALVVAKGGPKLQATKDVNGGSGSSSNGDQSGMQLTVTNRTLAELAETLTQELSRELGRNVVDKTGIEGKYDVTLKWTRGTDTAPVSGDTGLPPDSAPSIFTAIQEQLGLKLEPAKGPVQVLVIDHAEMPSEN
jgi:uncharacterized protein (TIGR03435 family)